MRVFSINRSDGGVSIMRLVDGADFDEAFANFTIKLKQTMDMEVVSHREISEDDVPAECAEGNREYRDAVVDDGQMVAVDMEKAKAIHRRLHEDDPKVDAAKTTDDLKALVTDRNKAV